MSDEIEIDPTHWSQTEEGKQALLKILNEEFFFTKYSVEGRLPEKQPCEIVFCPSSKDSNDWVMKLTKEGVFFNREVYSTSEPDDFAQAVIDILETCFTVNFERKEPPFILRSVLNN